MKKGSWWCPGAEGLVLDVAFRALVKPIGREVSYITHIFVVVVVVVVVDILPTNKS